MIDQGLQLLIQAGLGSSPPPGFAVQLPENTISATQRQAYTVTSLTSAPTYVLEGQDPLTFLDVRITCHGLAMADAVALAGQIESIMRVAFPAQVAGVSFSPLTLSDQGGTILYGLFRKPPRPDGYSDINRTFVRTLEYMVIYDQQ